MNEHTSGRDNVSDSAHLTALSLEQLAEGSLPERERDAARKHVDACRRCTAELEAYRSLFAMLGELPRFAPSPVFADGVMARVRIAPREHRVLAWLRRLVPTTRRGWLLLGTIVTAPAAPFVALLVLLLLHPLVTPTTLWQWMQIRTQAATETTFSWLLGQAAGGGIAQVGHEAYTAISSVPGIAMGIALLILAIGVPLSAWGLIRLTRLPVSRVTYAN